MDFISNKLPQIKEMLKDLQVPNINALLQNIPETILEDPPLDDDGLSEYEGIKLMEQIAEKNNFHQLTSYLGAGAYEHHVPSIVRSIISKSGFLTAYTPYQGEASQGLLQTIFEYQSAINRLTGLDLANASLYDGASAAAEALLMMLRLKPNRSKLFVAKNLHPHYQKVIQQYIDSAEVELKLIPMTHEGLLDFKRFEKEMDDQTAGVLFSYPNFFGAIENLEPFITLAHQKGALCALSSNPMVFGLYQSAKDLNIDLVVGDTQPFGIPLQFGGPYAGYMSCKKEFVRQLPGRLVGKTQDRNGNQGFVLTLQTREQHIRREKATSNICSNQALCALASLIAILWYGPEGVQKLALTNYQRAQFLRQELGKMTQVELLSEAPIFNEFVVKLQMPVQRALDHFRLYDIEAGLDLSTFYPEMKNHLLITVTETKSESALKRYIEVAKKIW